MPYAEDERQRIETWSQHIQVDHLRVLANEALRRVAARGSLQAGQILHDSGQKLHAPRSDEVKQLCELLLGHDFEMAESAVFSILKSGVGLEAVYHDYLGASAIRLGEMWDEDLIGFVDVTRGVARIVVLMRNLRERAEVPRITHEAPVLFASVPGETHAVGVTMARDLLRSRGWDVNLLIGLDHDQLVQSGAETDARVLGLSCGGAATAGALARLILAVRLVRPTLPILISGQIVSKHPNLVEAIAPDSAVNTIEEAISEIERMTGPLVRPKSRTASS